MTRVTKLVKEGVFASLRLCLISSRSRKEWEVAFLQPRAHVVLLQEADRKDDSALEEKSDCAVNASDTGGESQRCEGVINSHSLLGSWEEVSWDRRGRGYRQEQFTPNVLAVSCPSGVTHFELSTPGNIYIYI